MFKRHKFNNGLRVVYEILPYVRSVSTGIWVGTGSRSETKSNSGISHFVEHMMFKGTQRRSACQIAEEIDNIGGQINAFTGKECTCYYAKILDTHIEIAFDILADMLFNSMFAKKDIAIEKKVILEEIGMYEDSPEELVHDLITETVWKNNPVGMPVLGNKTSLPKINAIKISEYMDAAYNPENCVISVAGNFKEEELLSLIEKYFSRWQSKNLTNGSLPAVDFIPGFNLKKKDTEQVHLCIGFNGVPQGDEKLYPLLAINNVLGGGMSSRLFQKIREEKGLVYSIYSYPSAYKDAGIFTIYAGMNPVYMPKVVEMICNEINILKDKGIDELTLNRTKEQLKGNYILGLEGTS
ncbi:MAG: pitrilysin family protein, partial [Clostridiales bacterium]|nr:pitrilysin family protein [Clostridiales bacterium]